MFDNLKKVGILKDEVKDLNEQLTQAREDRDKAELALERDRTNNLVDLEKSFNQRNIEVTRLENQIVALEKSISPKVEKEVAQQKKDLRISKDRQDREHADRMKKLDAEHTAKISKMEKDLENDKVSYRKYLRSEMNSKIETLEKENKSLVIENISLTKEVKQDEREAGLLDGQNKVLAGIVSSLTKNLDTLSTKLGEGLVKALPEITADFKTPTFPENHIHVEPAKISSGGGNKEQKN